MHPIAKGLLVGAVVFLAPITFVLATNWESARKYFYVEPGEAVGYVLAIDAKG